MAAKKLTPAQTRALIALRNNASGLRINRATGNALVRAGLARAHRLFPSLPPSSYIITFAGRAHLRREERTVTTDRKAKLTSSRERRAALDAWLDRRDARLLKRDGDEYEVVGARGERLYYGSAVRLPNRRWLAMDDGGRMRQEPFDDMDGCVRFIMKGVSDDA